MDFYNVGKKFINFSKEEKSLIIISTVEIIYMVDFLRGYVETNSNFTKPSINKDLKSDDIVTLDIFLDNVLDNKSTSLIIDILNKLKIKYVINECSIQKNNHGKCIYNYMINISFYNVLDLLAILYYPNVSEFDKEYYSYYMTLSNFHKINFNTEINELQYTIPKCKYIIEDESAIIPTKAHASDIGYDLSIIKVHKQISEIITMYDTGIIVIPEYGYCFDIGPRSSLYKTGCILANSTGYIDGTYTDTIKVVLMKLDHSMPDIKLPFSGVQLILRKMTHFELIETSKSELIKTSRGSGAFGSTNKVINN